MPPESKTVEPDDGLHDWVETGESAWTNYTFRCRKCLSYVGSMQYVFPSRKGCSGESEETRARRAP